ncbi:hypothetical protein ACIHFD_35510 [Nonomuraea sp. NPDC051941]|uniref:hypothetical protein n=1 Tax=Nonomuraea sp. NPDC051941 TaxID=3364373 RepID=UPI0037C76B7E
MGGAPKFEESQTLPDVSYVGFPRSLGLEGIEVEKPEAIGPAWDRALAADRPVVLDVHCDPDIPPYTEFEQLKDVAEAIIKGDPGRRAFRGQNQYRRPPTGRPMEPRTSRITPMTSRMAPIV